MPTGRPHIAIAVDGTLAAIHESTRIAIVELPGGAPFAEVNADRDAAATEVAWVGAPPRLLVLARFASHTTVHLIDPHGPRTIAEIRLESPMRLFAAAGAHALAVGSLGAAILTATDTHLTPHQFPARTLPLAAGGAGNQLVVALVGAIEEWDPQTRMPRRRLKLPRPAAITAVGGNDRVVWLTTKDEPARVDVIPLVNRGQPKAHDLPEPIAHVSAHPRHDLLACVGADTGTVYVIDLDGRTRMRTIVADGIDRADAAGLVAGRLTGVLVAQAGKPIAIVPLDPAEAVEPLRSDTDRSHLEPVADEDRSRPVKATVANPLAAARAAQVVGPPPAFGEAAEPAAAPKKPLRTRPNAQTLAWHDARSTWRDDACTWARAIAGGAADAPSPPPPQSPPVDALATRFDGPASLVPALVLLYGAHLVGQPGAAPFDVARVIGRRWDEALGRGVLAARALAHYSQSRVHLASELRRALDELPPRTGVLVGEPGPIALLGPCCVVDDGPEAALAEKCGAIVGSAILVAHRTMRAHPPDIATLVLEARAYGATAMLRASPDELDRLAATRELPIEPIILVVPDEPTAERLDIPRL